MTRFEIGKGNRLRGGGNVAGRADHKPSQTVAVATASILKRGLSLQVIVKLREQIGRREKGPTKVRCWSRRFGGWHYIYARVPATPYDLSYNTVTIACAMKKKNRLRTKRGPEPLWLLKERRLMYQGGGDYTLCPKCI